MASVVALAFFFLFMFPTSFHVRSLSSNYYDHSCPQLESIVASAVKKAASSDKTVPAVLLRMHFHDCFIRGCDASVLLNSNGKNKAEKDGPPNISLHAFYVIDQAKKALEASCPGIVSCADVLAWLPGMQLLWLVTLNWYYFLITTSSGGPTWDVPKARKDGRISLATETRQLPASTFNISQLQQNFAQRGLSIEDLVALSGGHTLGFSHCSSFQNRIHSFNATLDVDPTMQPSFAARLRSVCPAHNKVKNAGSPLDSTSFVFDNAYYKLLLQGKSIFSSDQALLTNPKTKALVSKFASSQKAFEKAFVDSMIKMSSLTSGQEIRLDCIVVR
ncbi:Peroxidase 64 [Hibiscus syriacus]|uniref:Peroxidase n=1 Tax=Hibiscus syriacus TaxID=106335 RepID=A0A6A3BA76_HIBSY|nr:Peroxidase 64 [Hibiscus syriacus]